MNSLQLAARIVAAVGVTYVGVIFIGGLLTGIVRGYREEMADE